MSRRRTRREEHDNTDRWVVSYADFITLLFAFFTALYAISAVNTEKLNQFVGSMRKAFRSGQAADREVVIPVITRSHSPGNRLKAEIESVIARVRNPQIYSVTRSERGIIVSIGSAALFEPGSASLNESALEALEPIAMILKRIPNRVSIEGHTDNIRSAAPAAMSNWELSVMRAVNVLRYLRDRFGISQYRLSASGYADTRPLSGNSTPEGRARNRRVDIVILNNLEG